MASLAQLQTCFWFTFKESLFYWHLSFFFYFFIVLSLIKISSEHFHDYDSSFSGLSKWLKLFSWVSLIISSCCFLFLHMLPLCLGRQPVANLCRTWRHGGDHSLTVCEFSQSHWIRNHLISYVTLCNGHILNNSDIFRIIFIYLIQSC